MNLFKSVLMLAAMSTFAVHAKNVEYIEDAYTMPASPEIIEIVDKAAQLVEFNENYEVIVPKKSGMQINPWNKFISIAINPQTKNAFIMLNPAWLFAIPQEQQTFLLARSFMMQKLGIIPLSMKIIPYFFLIFNIFFIFLLVWLLGKTQLKSYAKWVRILLALCIVGLNTTITDAIQRRVLTYFVRQHDIEIIEKTLQITKNRDAAYQAFKYLDASIKNELQQGTNFFKPYEKLFESHVVYLKNSQEEQHKQ